MDHVGCFTHKRTKYFFEYVEDSDAHVLKLVYIVRGPRGGSYGLLRTADHPELLIRRQLAPQLPRADAVRRREDKHHTQSPQAPPGREETRKRRRVDPQVRFDQRAV